MSFVKELYDKTNIDNKEKLTIKKEFNLLQSRKLGTWKMRARFWLCLWQLVSSYLLI